MFTSVILSVALLSLVHADSYARSPSAPPLRSLAGSAVLVGPAEPGQGEGSDGDSRNEAKPPATGDVAPAKPASAQPTSTVERPSPEVAPTDAELEEAPAEPLPDTEHQADALSKAKTRPGSSGQQAPSSDEEVTEVFAGQRKIRFVPLVRVSASTDKEAEAKFSPAFQFMAGKRVDLLVAPIIRAATSSGSSEFSLLDDSDNPTWSLGGSFSVYVLSDPDDYRGQCPAVGFDPQLEEMCRVRQQALDTCREKVDCTGKPVGDDKKYCEAVSKVGNLKGRIDPKDFCSEGKRIWGHKKSDRSSEVSGGSHYSWWIGERHCPQLGRGDAARRCESGVRRPKIWDRLRLLRPWRDTGGETKEG